MTDKRSWGREVFDKLYQESADPWNFATSAYEQEKLETMLSFIPAGHRRFILELGCSIGISTRRLAERSDLLLAIDSATQALARARQICKDRLNIEFIEAFLPDAFPYLAPRSCDLVVISEILYFLSRDDIQELVVRLQGPLADDAAIVLVNWTGVTDTPCTGDDAAECFIRTCEDFDWVLDGQERRLNYRLDSLRRKVCRR